MYVGIDLHKHHHTAVIINCWHEKVGETTFENKPAAFTDFFVWIHQHVPEQMTPVFGLEDVGGYGRALAAFLVDHGQTVKEVNPALSYAERNSYLTVQKSDSWDAECIARVLVNKLDWLPDVQPKELYWTIKQLVTRRNALVKAQTTLKNQLHVQLSYHYPSYKKFFAKVDGKTTLAFWDQYPSPPRLEGVTVEELTNFLQTVSRNTCSSKKAAEILEWVKTDGRTDQPYQQTRDFLVQSIVRELYFKKQEITWIERELRTFMTLLDYQLETMPGIDVVTAAALVAEIGDIERFPNADKLARYAGIAPVHVGSGEKGKDYKSKQGNRTLHALLYQLAIQQIQVAKETKKPRNPVFYEYYQRKRKEGKTKGQARVCVMRRLVNVIYRMMKHKTAYQMPIIKEK
jgi:transposase